MISFCYKTENLLCNGKGMKLSIYRDAFLYVAYSGYYNKSELVIFSIYIKYTFLE